MLATVWALAQVAPGRMLRAEGTAVAPARRTNSVQVVRGAVVREAREAREGSVDPAVDVPALAADQGVVGVVAPAVELQVLLGVAAKKASPASRSGQSAKNLK